MTPAQQATRDKWTPKFTDLLGEPESRQDAFVNWRTPTRYVSLCFWREGGGEWFVIDRTKPLGHRDRSACCYFGRRHVNLAHLLDVLKREKEKGQ